MCKLYSIVSHTHEVGCVQIWGTDHTNDTQRVVSCKGSLIVCIFMCMQDMNVMFIYFPNGRYIEYLPLTYATNENKILQLHYKYYKYYKQHSR